MNDKNAVLTRDFALAFSALLILGGLTFYSLIRWNDAVSGSLVLGTVMVFRDVVTKFSDKATSFVPDAPKPTAASSPAQPAASLPESK